MGRTTRDSHPLLDISHVSFSYPTGDSILEDVSLQIQEGESLCLLGPNGSGKTTFFYLLGGLLWPSKGKLYFRGEPYSQGKPFLQALRRSMSLIFQDPDSMILAPTILEEVSFGPLNRWGDIEEARRRTQEALQQFGLWDRRRETSYHLSTGQKKRLNMAAAASSNPDIFLLDEPMAALDGYYSEEVEKFLMRWKEQGKTQLVISHDLDFTLRFANRVLLFFEKKIVFDGRPQALMEQRELMRKTHLRR